MESVTTSARVVDLLVGPAGAGKTTALAHSAWPGSPSTDGPSVTKPRGVGVGNSCPCLPRAVLASKPFGTCVDSSATIRNASGC
nr:hypothetical protein [Nocardioides luti]